MFGFGKREVRDSRPPAPSAPARRHGPVAAPRPRDVDLEDVPANVEQGDRTATTAVPSRETHATTGHAVSLDAANNPRVAELDHIPTFSRVPRFQGLLSGGDKPIVLLTKADRERVAVIEMVGRSAAIIHNNVEPAVIESIKGRLIESRYALRIATAELHVIKEIYQAGAKTDSSGSDGRTRNEFMAAVYEWIAYAVANRATDIHLETHGSTGRVRFRVDGEMEAMRANHEGSYRANFITDCMASLFNNSSMAKSGSSSTFHGEEFLYCMVPYSEIPGHTLKLRYQSLKGNEGPKLVLRILHVDENQPTKTFAELGYAPSQIAMWEEAMDTPSGLVAIAGVTSSGKSTTLKCFIELNPHTPTSNVLTIEDPVEYPIRGAHQVPVQRDLSDAAESAKRFTEALSSFMRADPDAVMMGEIRDRFSANAAQQLAETGHMALGTVHAHLLSGIVPRLVNPEIGMTRQILTAPNMVTLLAYQALVAILCPKCAMPTDEADHDQRVSNIADNVKQLGLDPSALRWKRIGGCSYCNGRGTRGQTVVAEMLMPDEDWLRHIREGDDTEAVNVYRSRSNRDLMSPDMTGKTVFEHTLHKALHGVVDARQCSAFDTWHRYMRYQER
jgi:type II secretory ATPase GspE/PulE/Tfp pilus assembly ATPase PilB-like protein